MEKKVYNTNKLKKGMFLFKLESLLKTRKTRLTEKMIHDNVFLLERNGGVYMNVKQLEEMLLQAQFTLLRSNVKEINMYYRIYGRSIYIFHVCDFSMGMTIEPAQFQNITRQIEWKFYDQGYQEINRLSLIITNDINWVKPIIEIDKSLWIVDAKKSKLIIFENQPSDFLSIRKALESLLDGNVVEHHKKTWKYISFMNTILIAINILVFLITEWLGDTTDGRFLAKVGAMYMPYIIQKGEFYRIFTSMFLHFGISHLTGNMVTLLVLGDNLERAVGKWKYLILYIGSGLGASMTSVLFNWITGQMNVVAAGASGAVFGVIGALFYITLQNKGKLENLTAPKMSVLILFVLYSGFTTSGTDNAAHIGGLFFGILIAIVLCTTMKKTAERK